MGKRQQYCSFFLEDECFGIEVEQVQEVINELPYTPVHLAPQIIKGMINLRGQIVVVLDFRALLEYPPLQNNKAKPMIIILKHKEHFLGCLIDSIGEVIEVDKEDFHPAPETLRGMAKKMILGTFKEKDLLLKVLCPESIKNFQLTA